MEMKLSLGVVLLTLSVSGILGFTIPNHWHHKCDRPDPILPIEVVHSGDACSCGETLHYHVEVPIKIEEAIKRHQFGYKIEVPPHQPEEIRYAFDYQVEVPRVKHEKQYYCGDLTSQVDRVLLPAKDCEHPAGECHCHSYKPDIQPVSALLKEKLHRHHSGEHDDYWSPHRYGKHKRIKRNCLSSSCEQCSTIANLKKAYKSKPVCDEVLQYLPELSQDQEDSFNTVPFESKCTKCNTPVEDSDCRFCEACNIQGKFNIFPNLECVCKCRQKGYANCPYTVDTSRVSVIPGLRYPEQHSHIERGSRIVYDHLGHKYIERNGHLRIMKPNFQNEKIETRTKVINTVDDEKISSFEFAKKLLHDYVDEKRKFKFSETENHNHPEHSYVHEERNVVVDKGDKIFDSNYEIKKDFLDHDKQSLHHSTVVEVHETPKKVHFHEVKTEIVGEHERDSESFHNNQEITGVIENALYNDEDNLRNEIIYDREVIPEQVVYITKDGQDYETVQTIHKNADSFKEFESVMNKHLHTHAPRIEILPEIENEPIVEPYSPFEPYPQTEPEMLPEPEIEPVEEVQPEVEPIPEVTPVIESPRENRNHKLAGDIEKAFSIFDDRKQDELSEAISRVFHELSYFDVSNSKHTVDKEIYNHATTENYARLKPKHPTKIIHHEKNADTKHEVAQGYVRNIIKSVRTGKLYEIDTVYGSTDQENQDIITEYENGKYPQTVEYYEPDFIKENSKNKHAGHSKIINGANSEKYVDGYYYAKEKNVKSKTTENCKSESHVKYIDDKFGNEYYYRTPTARNEIRKDSANRKYNEKETYYYMEPNERIQYLPKGKATTQKYVYEQIEPRRNYRKSLSKANSGPVWYFEPTKPKYH